MDLSFRSGGPDTGVPGIPLAFFRWSLRGCRGLAARFGAGLYRRAAPPPNYYLVKAVDLFDREVESISLLGQPEDRTPPVQVSGLSGSVTPLGAVSLQWTANPDDDLYGYRVYRAGQLEAEYVQVSEGTVSENAFSTQIAMNTLAEKAYFRVRAVDFRDNLGALSDPLELALPDVMPPAPPHLASVEPVKDGVKAVWSPSPSEDVTHYEVQRRSLLHPPGYPLPR
ncbi:MAG: hypothetical protein IPN20_00550 [Haliscomenobacter sp.]|nr:hypothetical protein [Haliscomenobacter sp.]